jgi:hypothetical protein
MFLCLLQIYTLLFLEIPESFLSRNSENSLRSLPHFPRLCDFDYWGNIAVGVGIVYIQYVIPAIFRT